MRLLYRLNRYTGYLLFILLALYFVTGFGILKGFMDPVFARNLHNTWLFFPTLVLVLFHSVFGVRRAFERRGKRTPLVDLYLAIIAAAILAIGIYLYLL